MKKLNNNKLIFKYIIIYNYIYTQLIYAIYIYIYIYIYNYIYTQLIYAIYIYNNNSFTAIDHASTIMGRAAYI